MRLLSLLGLIWVCSLAESGPSLAQGHRRVRQQIVTSSGAVFEINFNVPSEDSPQASVSRDPLVVISYKGLTPRPSVHLRLSQLVRIAAEMTQFRTDEEASRLGLAARVGDRLGKTIGTVPDRSTPADAGAPDRAAAIQTRERVKAILQEITPKSPSALAISPEEIQEVALMISLGEEPGKEVYASLQGPTWQTYAWQLPGAIGDYLLVSALIPLPLAKFCSRWLGREAKSLVVRVPGLLLRGVLAGAGTLDAWGRVADLRDGLDPGWSPLISALLFSDMDEAREGEEIRNKANGFQSQYQIK